jgi:hypothetical protein
MITELLGLAGSGTLGSLFGMASETLRRSQERKHDEVKLKLAYEQKANAQTFEHLAPLAKSNTFAFSFGMLVCTYCFCTALCFVFPDVPVHTFNPEAVPNKFGFLGFSYEWQRTSIYIITTGGVGLSLLHPIAFAICKALAGQNAR